MDLCELCVSSSNDPESSDEDDKKDNINHNIIYCCWGHPQCQALRSVFYVCCLISSAKPLQITSTDALLILFLAVLGLHCCRISLVAERGGYSLVAVLRLLISVASLREHGLEEHGLSSCGRATGHVGSWNRNQTHVPCIGRWIINHWTIREALISTLRKGKAKRKRKGKERLAAFSVTCTRSWVRKGWSQIWRRWIWADFLQTKGTWTVPPANPEWHDWAVLAETSYLPHPSLWNFPEDTKAACSITHRKEGGGWDHQQTHWEKEPRHFKEDLSAYPAPGF